MDEKKKSIGSYTLDPSRVILAITTQFMKIIPDFFIPMNTRNCTRNFREKKSS